MISRILWFCNLLENFCKRMSILGSWLILLMIVVIVYDVVTRKLQFIQQWVLESPLYDYLSPTKLQELEWHLHGIIFFFMLGYAYFRDIHIRVDLIRDKMLPRRQAMMEVWGLLIFGLPYTLLVTFMSIRFAWSSYLIDEGSAALTGLPHQWITKFGASIGMVLLCLAIVATLLRLLIYLFASEPESAKAAKDLDPIIIDSSFEDKEVL